MRAQGLEPEFPVEAVAETNRLTDAPRRAEEPLRDLRSLPWCSIDNDDSRDLDQLSVAESLADGRVKVLVAIADVAEAVPRQSATDRHAAVNTTSVYTPARIFPMLPERLSTDLTSLRADADRLAVIVEIVIAASGDVEHSGIYGAQVQNRAKLAYGAVGAWLSGVGPLPEAARAVSGLDEQLRLQDQAAARLERMRQERGAMEFDSVELSPRFEGDNVVALHAETANRAKSLIENLMIAANESTARFLEAQGLPSIRRVVRAPKRWDRIVELARRTGDSLPDAPDARALGRYLAMRKASAPSAFAELSHAVVKLIGSGEYAVDLPGGDDPGHFGLAVRAYTHSTAPNRRYPDLITQRLLKAALAAHPVPYTVEELTRIAAHCTQQEDAANKVERLVRKSAAALVMVAHIGERFDGVVAGASDKGTWVKLNSPPVEGKVVRGERGLDVGDRVNVRLQGVDVERGFIDFVYVGASIGGHDPGSPNH
jgi:VacB/RNase II family 3'-5' exoribonuclease